MLPSDFTFAHGLALGLLFFFWFAYTRILSYFGRGSLNSQLALVRRHWMNAATRRPAKPFDAVLLGHIVNSIAFFGSATLIVLAAVITSFASVKSIHATMAEVHFIAPVSLELFAFQVGLVAFVLALCFFSFTYALRKLIYAIALLGALPDRTDNCPTTDAMVDAVTMVLSEAIKTFNFGIRGYYYCVAALCLFLSPLACIVATLVVTIVLFYRQLATGTSRAIHDYVVAAQSIPKSITKDE